MKALCIEERLAKCADWSVPASELFGNVDDCRVAVLRPVVQWNTESGYGESRDWSRDKSRDWNASKNGGICWNCAKIVRWNKLKSRVRNEGKSRDWNGGKSRDRNITRTNEYKGESDNRQNGDVVKSRDRNVTKSRDRRGGRTTQQTTQDHTKKSHERNGAKRSDKSKHVIIALIERFPKIRQTEMAKATGLSVKGVEKVLARLKAANVIVRVGGR